MYDVYQPASEPLKAALMSQPRMSPISSAHVRQRLANDGIATLDPLAKTQYARVGNIDPWA